MRNSICRDHFMRLSAAALGVSAEGGAPDTAAASQYELMLYKLAEDKRRLKDIQSIERKADVKAQLLPEYLPWIDGTLANDSGRQDDVLMTVFVWAIDIGEFDLALRIGNYAILHGLTMPDQYKRDVPCVLAEEIADYALKQDDSGLVSQQPHIAQALGATANCDMPDEVRAKLLKANGYALRAAGDLVQAREYLVRALQLHEKVGVKKDIERLATLIKNSPPEETPEGG